MSDIEPICHSEVVKKPQNYGILRHLYCTQHSCREYVGSRQRSDIDLMFWVFGTHNGNCQATLENCFKVFFESFPIFCFLDLFEYVARFFEIGVHDDAFVSNHFCAGKSFVCISFVKRR